MCTLSLSIWRFAGTRTVGRLPCPGAPDRVAFRVGERRFANGHFMLSEGARLVTSRGIGMSDVPVRLFAPSEVHLYTIRAAA